MDHANLALTGATGPPAGAVERHCREGLRGYKARREALYLAAEGRSFPNAYPPMLLVNELREMLRACGYSLHQVPRPGAVIAAGQLLAALGVGPDDLADGPSLSSRYGA
jgi:hypothetical protein